MNLRVSRSSLVAWCGALGCGLVWACGSSAPPPLSGPGGGSTAGTGTVGQQGALGGACRANNVCDANLSCYGGICIPATLGTGGAGTGLKQGSLAGACYPNNTCDPSLMCDTGICIPSLGLGGSVGAGGAGQGGGVGQAGGSAQGGSAHGGSSAQGGTSSQAGTSSQGGTSQGGSVGAGGVAGTPSTSIVSADGWIGAGTNTVGVVGPWFVYSDVNSTINVTQTGTQLFTGAGSQICITGTVSQLDTYGPTIGFNFNEPDTTLGGWVPSAHSVTGFTFGISGTALPALQVGYHTLGDTAEYCKVMAPLAAGNSLPIVSTTLSCWLGGGAAGSTATSYQSLQFELPVNYFSSGQSYNFCITNLKATTG